MESKGIGVDITKTAICRLHTPFHMCAFLSSPPEPKINPEPDRRKWTNAALASVIFNNCAMNSLVVIEKTGILPSIYKYIHIPSPHIDKRIFILLIPITQVINTQSYPKIAHVEIPYFILTLVSTVESSFGIGRASYINTRPPTSDISIIIAINFMKSEIYAQLTSTLIHQSEIISSQL